ncbi:MAG: hypothetical protein WD230_03900 [Cucumibacter sp.]
MGASISPFLMPGLVRAIQSRRAGGAKDSSVQRTSRHWITRTSRVMTKE